MRPARVGVGSHLLHLHTARPSFPNETTPSNKSTRPSLLGNIPPTVEGAKAAAEPAAAARTASFIMVGVGIGTSWKIERAERRTKGSEQKNPPKLDYHPILGADLSIKVSTPHEQ